MVCGRAIKEAFSHARNKLLLGFVVAILATALQYALKLRGLTDSEKIAISLMGSAVVVMVGSFVWNLVRIPAMLYVEPPKRTPSNEHHYQEAKAALDELGAKAAVVLRHLKKHGQLTFNAPPPGVQGPPSSQSALPEGTTANETYASLEDCVRKSLVSHFFRTETIGPHQYGVTYIDFRIAEGMKDALDELLYASAGDS
jgi:hypothetical protein